MTTAAPLRLCRDQRIKRSGDFARARAEGQRIVNGSLILNWVDAKPGYGSRVGLITTKKLGGAVARTRARRLLREAFRLNQHSLIRAVDAVLIARRSIVEKDCGAVEVDLRSALRRAGLLKRDEPGKAHRHD